MSIDIDYDSIDKGPIRDIAETETVDLNNLWTNNLSKTDEHIRKEKDKDINMKDEGASGKHSNCDQDFILNPQIQKYKSFEGIETRNERIRTN